MSDGSDVIMVEFAYTIILRSERSSPRRCGVIGLRDSERLGPAVAAPGVAVLRAVERRGAAGDGTGMQRLPETGPSSKEASESPGTYRDVSKPTDDSAIFDVLSDPDGYFAGRHGWQHRSVRGSGRP